MAHYQRFHIPTLAIIIYIYEEGEDEDDEEIEAEAEVVVHYDYSEPEPDVGWPGSFDFAGVEEVGEITLNGERLEGWEAEHAEHYIVQWMDDHPDEVMDSMMRAAEDMTREAEEAKAEDRAYWRGWR